MSKKVTEKNPDCPKCGFPLEDDGTCDSWCCDYEPKKTKKSKKKIKTTEDLKEVLSQPSKYIGHDIGLDMSLWDIGNNNVSIEDLLKAIHVFHEVIGKEFPTALQDHPFIQLCADGGGSVIGIRTMMYGISDYPGGVLFKFNTLEQLVTKAKELCKKHDIIWSKDEKY